ncbi:helix-turn-helix domain-containing protein [soil metagenome]
MDLEFAAGEPLPTKAYPPRPQQTLCFYPKEPEGNQFQNSNKIVRLRTSLMGQQTITCHRHTPRNFMIFMVVFQPGILHRLTKIPADELNNCFLDAEFILGNELNFINEQLFHASSYTQMVAVVEKYLVSLIIKSRKTMHPVDKIGQLMQNMQNSNQYHSIDWFCQQACLSPRQFERKFKERMGVSPKHYARIIRFDRVFRMKNRYPEKDWLTLALYSGYHDYQHLVKEYQDFTGFTPNQFYALELKAPERRFGDVEI